MNRFQVAAAVFFLLAAAPSPTQESRAAARIEVRVVDEQSQPVAGVPVRAWLPFAVAYSELSRRDFRASSDASGVASFNDLLPGLPVVFEIAHDPWVPTRSPVAIPEGADGGGVSPIPEIVLTLGRTAHVAVKDAFGVPLEDAEVRVSPLVEARLERGGRPASNPDRGSLRSADVDGTGGARFEKLPAEILAIEVRAQGFETRVTTVDLRRAASAEAVVRLDRDLAFPGPTMPWQATVRDAFWLAETEALPVMVALTMDGERANDAMAVQHFTDREVIRLAELLPCLVGSVFGEGGVQARNVDHGEVDGRCSRYGSVSCANHQAIEAWARTELIPDPESFHVPHHVFLAADGRVLARREYYLSERELRSMMLRAFRDLGSEAAVWTCLRRMQPLWRTLCAEGEAEDRRSAVATLARLVEAGDGYAAMLLRGVALETMPGDVRLQLLDALLVAALDDPARTLESFLHDGEPAVRTRAWQRLASVADRINCAVAAAALAYEDDDTVFDAALRALKVDERGEAYVVAEPERGERWRIVEILLGRIDAASLKGIDAVLDQVGTEARNRILKALAMNPDDESGVRRLFSHASAPDSSAVAPMRVLAGAHSVPADRVKELLLGQARSENALVRQEAISQLGRFGGEALEAALKDAEAPVRIAAAVGLWRNGNRGVAEVLVDGLDDPEFGLEVRTILEGAYSDAVPTDKDGWRKWLEAR